METSEQSTSDLAKQAIQVCLCFHSRKGARAITQVFDRALAPSGLKATQLSLLMVVGARQPIKIGALADALVTDSTTVSRGIKPLLARNLLDIEQLSGDRRIKSLSLSSEGRRLLDLAMPLWQTAQTQVVRQLGNTTVQALLPGLEAASRLGPANPD
jgi:DNA-binding MarR family transcriptional regulator